MAALSTTPSQVHLLSNTTLNTSGGSVASASSIVVSPAEPPMAMRQNGDGTEAPAAPPKIQQQQTQPPIFESHSESVPVDGKPGITNFCLNEMAINKVLKLILILFFVFSTEEGVESAAVTRPYSMADFELIRVIGRGSYAKVLMVELRRTRRVYAMKVIKKELVTDDEVSNCCCAIQFPFFLTIYNFFQDIDWVQTEKHVFETASNHPFLVGLHSCFQTASRLFFVIEFVRGGDLMFHMQRQRRLPEEHARFYSAEISLALNFLHEKGIIYRDLKLDNVLLDHEGHIKLTDYGMCKEGIRPGDTTSTFCGTPNYIAPEILRGEDYSFRFAKVTHIYKKRIKLLNLICLFSLFLAWIGGRSVCFCMKC